MKLLPKLIADWPKLAWVASFADRSDTVKVCHGPMVEFGDDWCVEAVWAGDFAEGDFDGNLHVDDADLSLLLCNLGAVSGGQIPEPATLALLSLGGLVIMKRRTRG